MKISICTITARLGFAEYQAKMLANQTYKDIEWVLVDFGFESRAKMIKDLSKELNLKIIHKPNVRNNDLIVRDISRNRNKALALATGDAVIFLDDYAVIYPDFVENHLPILKDNIISAGMMFRHEQIITDDLMKDVENTTSVNDLMEYDLKQDVRYRGEMSYRSKETYTGNLGIPRVVFETLNGFDPRLDGSLEDADLGMRARLSNFESFFNPKPYTVNLYTGNKPYTYSFDHNHDVEPFVAGFANHFSGDVHSSGNDMLSIEFKDHYRIAHCKICGARAIVDGTELMYHKQEIGETKVPEGLPGGYDTLKKELLCQK
jgi:glycosyltransferase involved in cell wall biosynthesis